jgi:anti-sigma regulatory factor (Ser/Thr protein kinase)
MQQQRRAGLVIAATDTSFARLFLADARRGLIVQPLWILGGTLFYWTLETAGQLEVSARLGFWSHLLGWVLGDAFGMGVFLLAWYALANRAWQRSDAARVRYTREGLYAVLPWQIGLPVACLAIIVSCVLAYVSFVVLMDGLGAWTPARRALVTLEGSMVFHFCGMSTILMVEVLRVRARTQRLLAERAHRLQVEAQLQTLQAQLEPHMLFNTLANLHALIDTQPAKAQDMLAHLIDYLRATLNASRRGSISLGEEMAQVQNYLHLMQIRMGSRLRVQIDIPHRLYEWSVPPMLIQPLVENALKHGLEPKPDGGLLRIQAWEEAGKLHVCVTDDGQGVDAAAANTAPAISTLPNTHTGGFGLACVRSRLQACWGSAAQLSVGRAPSGIGTVSTLTMPALATDTATP